MTGLVSHVQFKTFTFKKTSQPFFMDGVQLLFLNTQSLGRPGAHLVNLRKKGWADLGATQLFSN